MWPCRTDARFITPAPAAAAGCAPHTSVPDAGPSAYHPTHTPGPAVRHQHPVVEPRPKPRHQASGQHQGRHILALPRSVFTVPDTTDSATGRGAEDRSLCGAPRSYREAQPPPFNNAALLLTFSRTTTLKPCQDIAPGNPSLSAFQPPPTPTPPLPITLSPRPAYHDNTMHARHDFPPA